MRLWAATLTMLLMLTAHARADVVADAIKAGGVAILMRHASAPGTFDPEHFRLDDCATQRNLAAMTSNPTDLMYPANEMPRGSDTRAADSKNFNKGIGNPIPNAGTSR